jgi:hypothetical protein
MEVQEPLRIARLSNRGPRRRALTIAALLASALAAADLAGAGGVCCQCFAKSPASEFFTLMVPQISPREFVTWNRVMLRPVDSFES